MKKFFSFLFVTMSLIILGLSTNSCELAKELVEQNLTNTTSQIEINILSPTNYQNITNGSGVLATVSSDSDLLAGYIRYTPLIGYPTNQLVIPLSGKTANIVTNITGNQGYYYLWLAAVNSQGIAENTAKRLIKFTDSTSSNNTHSTNTNSNISATITSPTNSQVITNGAPFVGSAYSDAGLSTAHIMLTPLAGNSTNQIDVSLSGNSNTINTNISSSEGYYYLWLTVKDTVSNSFTTPINQIRIITAVSDSNTNVVDTTNPNISIISPTNGEFIGQNYNFSGTASDNVGLSNIYIQSDGNGFSPYSISNLNWSIPLTVTNVGYHTNRVYAVDFSGNVSLTNTVYFQYEAGLPSININSPGSGIYTNKNLVRVSGTASVEAPYSILRVELSLNNGAYYNINNTNWYYDLTLTEEGSNLVKARVIADNNKTNYASEMLYFKDTTPPTIDLVSPSDGEAQTNNNNFALSGTASDSVSGVKNIYYNIDSGSYQQATGTTLWNGQVTAASSNSHTITYYGTDNAGNSSPTNSLTVIVVIEATPFTVYFYKPSDWSTPINVHYWDGDCGTTEWPGDQMTDMGNGWWSFGFNGTTTKLIFTDKLIGSHQTADLTQSSTGWYSNDTWLNNDPFDSTPPTVSLLSPDSTTNVSGNLDLVASASDNNEVWKVEFYYDSTLIAIITNSPYSHSWNSAYSPNGTHTITAKAYDFGGNTSTTPGVNVTTDNTNVAPIANAGSDIHITPGDTANFDGSGSYDPNGSIVSYTWDNGLTGSNPSKIYSTISTNIVTLTVQDDDGATGTDTVTVYVTEFTHRDFREENVYFMMTDRFADGDPNNNNLWGDEYLPNGESDKYRTDDLSKSGVLSYYHGGDFQGIINNLDYLTNMGFTAIWITPVVKQPEGRYEYDPNDTITGGGGDYYAASAFHGYWGYDFDQIDPHLHSSGTASDGWADFDNLVNTLHEYDMRLMLDIVCNHGHGSAASQNVQWFDDRNSVIMDGQTWTWETGDPYFNASDTTYGFFNYIGGYNLADLIDFNERGPDGYDAREHLKNVYKKFIDHGVDAFRIDTIAYMTGEWWAEFSDEMVQYARSKGNDHFYMCGEAWMGDRNQAIDRLSQGVEDALHMLDLHASCMDYPGQMKEVFNGGSFETYSSMIGDNDYKLPDPTMTGMFVDNHDIYRANGIYNETQYKDALNYIYLFRGIPIVYYGTEAMYSWSGAIATTIKDDVVSRWMLGEQGISYVENNQPGMYQHLKMLNFLKSSSTAIQKGQQTDLVMSGGQACFVRDYNSGEAVAYVAQNVGDSAYTYTFTGMYDGTYRLITPDSANGTWNEQNVTVSGGSYEVTAPAHSFVILDK